MSAPMTPDQTLAVFTAEGLHVREYAGWRGRCRCCPDTVAHRPAGPWIRPWGNVVGQLAHITAGALGKRTVQQYIRDIINGDPVTPCKSHTVIDPDGVVWLNSTGRCNHAGNVGRSVRSHLRAADFSLSDDFDNRFTGGAVNGNAFTYGDEVIAARSMNAAQYKALVMVHAARARFHGWTGQESVGHGEVSNQRGKGDPNLDMGQFRRDVMAQLRDKKFSPGKPPVTPVPTVTTARWGEPATWRIGSVGPDVTRLGQRLVAHARHLGLSAPYRVGPGPEFTETDRAAVAAFQRAQGWSGGDADGYPGPETFRRLASDPVVKPTTPPEPTPQEPPASRPSFQAATVLSLNLGSRNATVNAQMGPWSKRSKKAAVFSQRVGADFVVLQETYAAQLDELMEHLGDSYTVRAVKGGRVILRRGDLDVAATGPRLWVDLIPGSPTKYAVARKFTWGNGAVLNLVNVHLSYETSATGVKKRASEVPKLLTWVAKHLPTGYDLIVGDVNSPAGGTTRRDDVGPLFAARGYRDLGMAMGARVGKGRYHLDRAFGKGIRVLGVKVLGTDFTDHNGVVFTVNIPTK